MNDIQTIEVRKNGDFDMGYTDTIWQGTGEIPSSDNITSEEFIILLKMNGFTQLKTIKSKVFSDSEILSYRNRELPKIGDFLIIEDMNTVVAFGSEEYINNKIDDIVNIYIDEKENESLAESIDIGVLIAPNTANVHFTYTPRVKHKISLFLDNLEY